MVRKKVINKGVKREFNKGVKREFNKGVKREIQKNDNPKKILNKKTIIIIVLALLILLTLLVIYLYRDISTSGHAILSSESSDADCIKDSQCPSGLKCLACERINSAIVASYPVSKDRPGKCVKSCL